MEMDTFAVSGLWPNPYVRSAMPSPVRTCPAAAAAPEGLHLDSQSVAAFPFSIASMNAEPPTWEKSTGSPSISSTSSGLMQFR